MRTLSRILALTTLLGFGACGNGEPGLWANTTTDEYASYCTISYCDLIETSAEPECICPCQDDSDGGDSGGGDDGSGGDGNCGEFGCDDGGNGGGGDGATCYPNGCEGGDGSGCGETGCDGGGGGDGSGSGSGSGSGGGDGSGGGSGSGSGGSGGDGSGSGGTDGGGDVGCSLTQGYWKNHNEFKTKASQMIDWPAPMDERAQLCGKTLLDILNTPSGGSAWMILAHQYIAASLNAANGASSGAINTALTEARTMLLTCNITDRQKAIDLSYTLDSYNNGLIGPGHCD